MEPGARALLHANQPSLRLPAALPPSSRPPSSALPLPPAALPPFQRARRRRHPLPAPSLSRASFPPLASGARAWPPCPTRPRSLHAVPRGRPPGPGPHASHRRALPRAVLRGPARSPRATSGEWVSEERPGNLPSRGGQRVGKTSEVKRPGGSLGWENSRGQEGGKVSPDRRQAPRRGPGAVPNPWAESPPRSTSPRQPGQNQTDVV